MSDFALNFAGPAETTWQMMLYLYICLFTILSSLKGRDFIIGEKEGLEPWTLGVLERELKK